MGKIPFQADNYFNNKSRLDRIFGDAVKPVDINGGLVQPKTDKWGTDVGTLETIEEGIQEQFGLLEPNEG